MFFLKFILNGHLKEIQKHLSTIFSWKSSPESYLTKPNKASLGNEVCSNKRATSHSKGRWYWNSKNENHE